LAKIRIGVIHDSGLGGGDPSRKVKWIMRRVYHVPVLSSRRLELGLFGDYGQGSGGEVVVPPTPVRVVDFFEMHQD
jgi:hypothetical protein